MNLIEMILDTNIIDIVNIEILEPLVINSISPSFSILGQSIDIIIKINSILSIPSLLHHNKNIYCFFDLISIEGIRINENTVLCPTPLFPNFSEKKKNQINSHDEKEMV